MRSLLAGVLLAAAVGLLAFGCDAAASAPARRSAASAAAVPKVHRRIALIGFNDNSVAQGLVSPAIDADLLASTGANTVRVTLNWAVVEPAPGQFNFSATDALYQAMAQRGIKVLWIPMFAPGWATGLECLGIVPPCHAPPTTAHDRDWEQLIADIAQRYPDSAGIEVWNEPNYVQFWQPRPDPSRYVQLLAEAYQTVKRVDPSMPVVSAGIGDVPPSQPGDIGLLPYLQDMFADGAGADMDAVAVHPYPYGADQAPFTAAMDDVQSVLADHGLSRLPVWITEMGVSTTGPSAVTPSEQATELDDLYRRAEAIPDVQAVFLHTLLDPPGLPDNPEVGFGIFSAPNHPKPAARLVKRLFAANARAPSGG